MTTISPYTIVNVHLNDNHPGILYAEVHDQNGLCVNATNGERRSTLGIVA